MSAHAGTLRCKTCRRLRNSLSVWTYLLAVVVFLVVVDVVIVVLLERVSRSRERRLTRG